MLALPVLSLAIISATSAASTTDNTRGLSLLDIVDSKTASALEEMLDNSPGHTYIKSDLSDVNLLKVSIIDGSDESVVTYMEMATNDNAAAYRRALDVEIDGESETKALN